MARVKFCLPEVNQRKRNSACSVWAGKISVNLPKPWYVMKQEAIFPGTFAPIPRSLFEQEQFRPAERLFSEHWPKAAYYWTVMAGGIDNSEYHFKRPSRNRPSDVTFSNREKGFFP